MRTTHVDFDLHGLLKIRLINAPPAALTAVTSDTGLIARDGSGDPAVVAEFVDSLTLSEPIHRIGRDAGFSGDAFILGAKPGRRVAIDVDPDGATATLRCERDVVHLPHLVALVNLVIRARGAVAVHAAA